MSIKCCITIKLSGNKNKKLRIFRLRVFCLPNHKPIVSEHILSLRSFYSAVDSVIECLLLLSL